MWLACYSIVQIRACVRMCSKVCKPVAAWQQSTAAYQITLDVACSYVACFCRVMIDFLLRVARNTTCMVPAQWPLRSGVTIRGFQASITRFAEQPQRTRNAKREG